MNNPYEANPTGSTKLASTRKMTSSSEINQRNPRHNQPNHPTGNQASHATGTKNLALTNKHTVEFSNNRHTPTQHHPTGQNLAWGNPSTLPGLPRLLNPGCSPWSSHRGLPRRGQRTLYAMWWKGFDPGTSHPRSFEAVSVPPCRADIQNITRPRATWSSRSPVTRPTGTSPLAARHVVRPSAPLAEHPGAALRPSSRAAGSRGPPVGAGPLGRRPARGAPR